MINVLWLTECENGEFPVRKPWVMSHNQRVTIFKQLRRWVSGFAQWWSIPQTGYFDKENHEMKPEVIYAGSPPGGDSIYGHWPWLKVGGRRGPWNLCFWYQKLLETSRKSIEMFKPLSLERLGHKMSILNVVAKTVLVLFLLSQKKTEELLQCSHPFWTCCHPIWGIPATVVGDPYQCVNHVSMIFFGRPA